MKAKAGNQNRFFRIITIPIRALGKARDFYVKSMTDYADRVSYGNVMAGPGTGQAPTLPRSFSVHTTRSYENGDISELIRASSTRSSGGRVGLDSYMQKQMQMKPPSSGSMGSRAMPRSRTVVMGRIDEDRPSIYFGENNVNKVELMYPRSRSHAVPRQTVY
ncbi:unnamed protein product [Fraxinus pennsylvanica]|uniref:Uncharacterized protein n=1 Tax=Fraxinus pennsylvanica TaxID=56036 RepID=A0AAD1YM04_9LAMI|nr:unnamed protein product [Fraxinus pennsylvanica]